MRKLTMAIALVFIFVSLAAFGSVPQTDAQNVRPGAQESLVDGVLPGEVPGVCAQEGSTAGAANQTLDESTGWNAVSDPTREVQRATVLSPCGRGQVTICERRCGSCEVLPGECCHTVCYCVEIGLIVRN